MGTMGFFERNDFFMIKYDDSEIFIDFDKRIRSISCFLMPRIRFS